MKCDACGAPVENGRCTYCGKVFPMQEEETTSKHHYERPTTVNVNINQNSVPNYTRPATAPKPKKKMGCGTIILIVLAVFVILYFYFAKMKLVVKNKRIYGKAGFGIQVDLPMDSISSVRMGIFRNIVIGTS